jgi:phage terminase large subunit GpA-like protein
MKTPTSVSTLEARLVQSRKATLAPPPRLNLVEWADQFRYLSPESSSIPGRWKTSNVEAARGPMLAVTDPSVHTITVMGPTQLLKTELINNIVGYFVHQDPSPIIVMQPTGKIAEAWSKDRLDKMLRDCPVLQGRVKDKRSRDSDNTILHKSFPGGHITVVGSNSPSDLASRPIRIVLCDEVDKYPESAGKEGDPIKLLEERSDTFWNALKVRVCSPTISGRSRIEAEYELSDKRVFHGLCPHCQHFEELKWEQIKWDETQPETTAAYECSKCSSRWSEPERLEAIANGKYIATAPFNGHAGFKVNKIASPWQPVSILVRKWLDSQDSPEKLKTFVNTQLAETWAEKGEVPEFKRLYERRELYKQDTLPKGVAFLTAGADVQKDRIEVEIVGWGRDKQSWSIDYRVYMGDTAVFGQGAWLEVDKLLQETWKTESNLELQLRMLAVDSGYNTQHVYDWVRRHSPERVRAVKGSDNLQSIFSPPRDIDVSRDGNRLRRAVKVWPVGVSVIKSELYSWLRMDAAGDDGLFLPGYCHFPQYSEEHFKRLCSEQLVKRTVNGRNVYRWIKVYERNEQLDCRIYARAAASMFGMDRFKDEEWNLLLGEYEVPAQRNAKPKNQPSEDARNSNQEPTSKFWGDKGSSSPTSGRKSIWNRNR